MVNYGYQGTFSEEVSEFELNYNEFQLRTYDPQIGRWTTPDPYDEFASPYLGMGNDPANNVDPSGGSILSGIWSFFGGGGSSAAASAIKQVACPGTTTLFKIVVKLQTSISYFLLGAGGAAHAINKNVGGDLDDMGNGGSFTNGGNSGIGGNGSDATNEINNELNNGLVANAGNPDNTPPKNEINVFVSPKSKDDALTMSYNEAKDAEKKSNGKLVVLEVEDLSDLIKQLKEKTKNGVKVNTMIIDSHGDYNKAKTQIGSTVIRDGNGKNLEELGKFFIDNQKGKIVLLACHAGGNTINNGEKLIVNLSCTTHTTVIGCRSWTGAIGLFGKGLNPSQPNPPRFEDNEGRLAWDFLGQWNMSSNGTSVNTLKMGIQLTSDGSVRRNILSIQPKISKFIKRWVF